MTGNDQSLRPWRQSAPQQHQDRWLQVRDRRTPPVRGPAVPSPHARPRATLAPQRATSAALPPGLRPWQRGRQRCRAARPSPPRRGGHTIQRRRIISQNRFSRRARRRPEYGRNNRARFPNPIATIQPRPTDRSAQPARPPSWASHCAKDQPVRVTRGDSRRPNG